ncbi:MAG: hypothetical protein FWG87_00680 [Defluviitaleaceae bacterium]|nr:hypothetical protein [Defluviitaleaceae bacterium]
MELYALPTFIICQKDFHTEAQRHRGSEARKASLYFVGDGFIRPEVCTLYNSGQVTSIKVKRGNLGTDKSVPYR